MSLIGDEKAGIIQWRVDTGSNHYEDWPGYCEKPMPRNDMLFAWKNATPDGLTMNFVDIYSCIYPAP
ncbi:MAG: hypothetical protein QM652_13820 [Legionella sp.]|uniref:hypothetical protein n=1 Tax=Legionella sp. TaxID=459 RepID=UPI0039E2F862